MPTIAKAPFLLAAGLLLATAGLIAGLAIRPLGWADVLGIVACTASASVFLTIPVVINFVRRIDIVRTPSGYGTIVSVEPAPPEPKQTELFAQIAGLVDARLAAALPAFTAQLAATAAEAEEKRRAEVLASIAATTPPRGLDTDALPSSSVGARPRLGRGLLGLMHAPGAIHGPGDRTSEPTTPGESPTVP